MFSANGINGDMNVTLWPLQVLLQGKLAKTSCNWVVDSGNICTVCLTSRMASCTTVASRFWLLRSSGLLLMFPLRYAAPCWRAGVNDWKVSWEKNLLPSRLWTASTRRRVSSWNRSSMRSTLPRSLAQRWGPTWASRYHQTRWGLESEDGTFQCRVLSLSCVCLINKSWQNMAVLGTLVTLWLRAGFLCWMTYCLEMFTVQTSALEMQSLFAQYLVLG